jgi:hypothetical protein
MEIVYQTCDQTHRLTFQESQTIGDISSLVREQLTVDETVAIVITYGKYRLDDAWTVEDFLQYAEEHGDERLVIHVIP